MAQLIANAMNGDMESISRHSEAGKCRPCGQCVEFKVVMVPISAFGVPQIWYCKWFAPDTFLVYIKQVFVLDDSQTNFSCASTGFTD